MIASSAFLALVATAAAVSARVVPRTSPPAGWWTEGLEDYDAYHTRYLALGCQNYHGQEFFDLCCHPLKKDETLETARAPECIPSTSSSASACVVDPTSAAAASSQESVTSATATASLSVASSSAAEDTSSPASPSATSAVNVATGDGDNDDSEDCDEDGEDSADDDDGEDGEDGDDSSDDEDCEDGEDGDGDASSSEPSIPSAPVPTSVQTSLSSETFAPESTSSSTSTFVESTSPTSSTFTLAPSPESSSSSSSSEFTTEAPSTEAPPAPSSSGSPSSGGDVVTGGFATFFYQNGVAGACGAVHPDSDAVAAIDSRRYGNTGEHSDLCGKQVKVTNTNNNKSVLVTIADACPTCENENCIDLSTSAFDQIADESDGIVPIAWQFV